MNARTTKVSQRRKPLTSRDLRRRGICRRCRLCAPSGQCRDTAIRSGRCGDWVWYMLGGKQFRRLWVTPHDPRTPSQLHWRARLRAVSRRYSRALTDQQQNACIAAGAKRRSRPRLGQWGWLTGQQYWVGKQCATRAQPAVRHAERAIKGLQTQEISRPTWEPYRGISVGPPGPHRRHTGSARWRTACNSRTLPVPGRASVLASPNNSRTAASQGSRGRSPSRRRCPGGGRADGVEANWRRRQRAVERERGPPEQNVGPRETIQPPGSYTGV